MAEPVAYDSRPDTMRHIGRVRSLLMECVGELYRRSSVHDKSKLVPPEKEAFDRCTPMLEATDFGTPEYTAAKAELGEALEHHYKHNRHHPEHFDAGVFEMNLIDLLEMLADWKAAGERHRSGGDLMFSIEQKAKDGVIDQTQRTLLENTARDLGWADA